MTRPPTATAVRPDHPPPSLPALARRFPARIAVTVGLVLLEALLGLLFPAFIAFAVNDLLDGSRLGVLALAGLGVASLAVGAGRRLYDTRVYAHIYEVAATELADRERDRGTEVSATAARASLLTEVVEFLENSVPGIVGSVIGIAGSLAILAAIDVGVFLACLGLAALTVITFWVTGGRNLRLNAGYNDELERQVDALAAARSTVAAHHFARLMGWNRKLSDLETANFSMIYLGVIGVLAYAPFALVGSTVADYGVVLAGLMYVFDYIEGLMAVPLHLQQGIRLKEIAGRLAGPPADDTDDDSDRPLNASSNRYESHLQLEIDWRTLRS
ncbi:MAG: ABC transporter six-transmembrane domain-containing protein [Actinomycetota bacterium]